MAVRQRRCSWFLLAMFMAVVLAACSEENAGFRIPPIEEIEEVGLTGFPGSVEEFQEFTVERTKEERFSVQNTCRRTTARSKFVFGEPVLWSEFQAWQNEQAELAGWTVNVVERSPFLEAFSYSKDEINGRSHSFSTRAENPDEAGTICINEDQLVAGYQLRYTIALDPEHPFC